MILIINIFSPELEINLPIPKKDIILSQKDNNAPFFKEYKLNPTM
jgi:dTDP-4-dehydrorhamnose 3,5-epimerase-like enzyme